MKIFIMIVALSTLPGCAYFATNLDRAAGKIADGVNTYCLETDENFRTALRADVNAQTDGHTIAVNCVQ